MQMEKGTFRRSLERPTLGVPSGRVSGRANPADGLRLSTKLYVTTEEGAVSYRNEGSRPGRTFVYFNTVDSSHRNNVCSPSASTNQRAQGWWGRNQDGDCRARCILGKYPSEWRN